MRIEQLIPRFSAMPKQAQLALIEHVRTDRHTSKAILKKTSKRTRVNAMSKLEAILAGMSEEDRARLMKEFSG